MRGEQDITTIWADDNFGHMISTTMSPTGLPWEVGKDTGITCDVREYTASWINRSVGFHLVCPEWLSVTPMQSRVRTECVVRVRIYNKERTDFFREGGSGWIEVLGDEGTVEKIPVLVRKGKKAPACQGKADFFRTEILRWSCSLIPRMSGEGTGDPR